MHRFVQTTLVLILCASAAGITSVAIADPPGSARAGERAPRLAVAANRLGFSEIVVMDENGQDRQVITPPPPQDSDAAGYVSPAWSPDGQLLAFSGTGNAVREDERDSEIYLAGPEGSGLLRLTRNRVADTSPSWSGDGERLVFSRGSADQRRSALFVMRRDGSGLRRLTSGRFFDFGPRWSPVDGRILFTRFDFAGPRFFVSIMVMDVAGRGKPRRLADGASGSWSSDANQIVFTSFRDRFGQTCFHECGASSEIYLMNANGKSERRLTRSRANDMTPSFVPGTRLVSFTSDRGNRETHNDEVYLMRPGSKCIRRITHTKHTISDDEPVWDPLGRPLSLRCP